MAPSRVTSRETRGGGGGGGGGQLFREVKGRKEMFPVEFIYGYGSSD